MSRFVKLADFGHKMIGLGLIGFTVIGGLNIVSMFHYKARRNEKVQRILEEETQL
jgi:hypothetical protein